jgi:hypothetical protein
MDGPCETKEEWLNRLSKQNPHLSDPSPMVQRFNYRPEGKKCKDCEHHFTKNFAKNYHKCAVFYKRNTGGPGTDIRVGWKACKKFKAMRGEGE